MVFASKLTSLLSPGANGSAWPLAGSADTLGTTTVIYPPPPILIRLPGFQKFRPESAQSDQNLEYQNIDPLESDYSSGI